MESQRESIDPSRLIFGGEKLSEMDPIDALDTLALELEQAFRGAILRGFVKDAGAIALQIRQVLKDIAIERLRTKDTTGMTMEELIDEMVGAIGLMSKDEVKRILDAARRRYNNAGQ